MNMIDVVIKDYCDEIKNPDKYNCLSELEILIILRLMKEDDVISGYYDKESECWLWGKKDLGGKTGTREWRLKGE